MNPVIIDSILYYLNLVLVAAHWSINYQWYNYGYVGETYYYLGIAACSLLFVLSCYMASCSEIPSLLMHLAIAMLYATFCGFYIADLVADSEIATGNFSGSLIIVVLGVRIFSISIGTILMLRD